MGNLDGQQTPESQSSSSECVSPGSHEILCDTSNGDDGNDEILSPVVSESELDMEGTSIIIITIANKASLTFIATILFHSSLFYL